ncbi:related to lipase (lipP) [Fusarium proliferatum]|nr:related to lipase (lipP) [Fusarium proliferatum]
MDTYLDPINRKFADAAAEGPPLYTKTYQEARDILEGIQSYKTASDIKTEEVKVPLNGEDVTTVIFRPADAQGTLNMIFYTHGGGWILGSPTVHGALMEDFARQTGAAVVFPYYTPAPEAQYPVQFEQVYGVLDHFVNNGDKYKLKVDRFGLAGDSVGGHMAIAMTQLAQSRNLPSKIGQLVLLYPVTDTHSKSETYKTYKDGPYLSEKTMDWMIPAFLPNEEERKLPLTSPLQFAPDEVLAKFPPTTIFVSGADPLIGEGEAFGHRLQQLGVDTAVLKADGQVHDFAMLAPIRVSPTARAVVELASSKLLKAFSEN